MRLLFYLNSSSLSWLINHFPFVEYILIFNSLPFILSGLKRLSRGQHFLSEYWVLHMEIFKKFMKSVVVQLLNCFISKQYMQHFREGSCTLCEFRNGMNISRLYNCKLFLNLMDRICFMSLRFDRKCTMCPEKITFSWDIYCTLLSSGKSKIYDGGFY
jgi:hypothetical protein